MAEVPAAKINLEFVLGNKVMVGAVNGNREYFEAAIGDLAMAEAEYPGRVARLLTHPVQGLDSYRELIDRLMMGNNVIKAFSEIAPVDTPTGAVPTAAGICSLNGTSIQSAFGAPPDSRECLGASSAREIATAAASAAGSDCRSACK